MIVKIKSKIDKEFEKFINNINNQFKLSKSSNFLFNNMKKFVLRGGKRIRPILFILSYKSFTKRNPKNLYKSALALELLHSFLLIHDDIVDNSDTRRGKASMHKLLQSKRTRLFGKNLALITGDIMYAIAIEAFLAVEEDLKRKEKALKKFIESACYTGCGEFLELLYAKESIQKINKENILKIYHYKTSYYTFITPLITAAILAGAGKKQLDLLNQVGTLAGRAFQIKDDLNGIFNNEKTIGKPNINDLQEKKKTLLIFTTYKKATKQQKQKIKKIFNKKTVSKKDLKEVKDIIIKTKSLEDAKKQIKDLLNKSLKIIKKIKISTNYKNALSEYLVQIIKI